MGDGVNIAARLEGICEPGAICLSEDAYRQVSGRLDKAVTDLGPTQLKNIESRSAPIRSKSAIPRGKAGQGDRSITTLDGRAARRGHRGAHRDRGQRRVFP